VLFSEPKIPQCARLRNRPETRGSVSVLFSEPKIPQSRRGSLVAFDAERRFSALQRAENSSIGLRQNCCAIRIGCFSALQRAENSSMQPDQPQPSAIIGFSALQRAENSSICARGGRRRSRSEEFQCSSASRKFLNSLLKSGGWLVRDVSVLFSEPKIPQSSSRNSASSSCRGFSALQRAENSSIANNDAI